MTDIPVWLLVILANKLLLYIAFAMTVGGASVMLIKPQEQSQRLDFLGYSVCGALLGLVASTASFFLQVGSFAESGLAGMMDETYIQILWETGAGMSYQLRLLGWTSIVLLLIVLRTWANAAKTIALLCLLFSLLIASSFTVVGHTTEQPLWVRFSLVLHVMIAMWWIGMLYPLKRWCGELAPKSLQYLMTEFGKQASYLVFILIVAGIAISYKLEGSIDALLNSLHGNILLLKVASVAAILALAARHKLSLVPSLTSKTAANRLQRSICIEMIIALIILVITAVLSTLVGPSHS